MQRRLQNTPGLELIFGEAKVHRPAHGRGSTAPIVSSSADNVFINIGGPPGPPRCPKASTGGRYLDSTSIMELGPRCPTTSLVLGGGYIGLEFAQMFRRFGSQVTVVQRGEHLLPREDADVAAEVAILG